MADQQDLKAKVKDLRQYCREETEKNRLLQEEVDKLRAEDQLKFEQIEDWARKNQLLTKRIEQLQA